MQTKNSTLTEQFEKRDREYTQLETKHNNLVETNKKLGNDKKLLVAENKRLIADAATSAVVTTTRKSSRNRSACPNVYGDSQVDGGSESNAIADDLNNSNGSIEIPSKKPNLQASPGSRLKETAAVERIDHLLIKLIAKEEQINTAAAKLEADEKRATERGENTSFYPSTPLPVSAF